MKETTWLFITRAQPGFHDGHIDSILEAINAWITKILIGVWSADKEFTKDNPFTYQERKHMIALSLKEKMPDLKVDIYPIPHSDDSEKRKNYIMDTLPAFDYVISSNPMVQEWFKWTEKLFFQTSVTTNTRASVIRHKIALWDYNYLSKVLPNNVVEYIKEIKAYERLKDIFKQERVTPNLVVDMVLCDDDGKLILIQRKNLPEGIALPWGFVDYWETTHNAAIRETKEEIGLDVEIEKELGIWDNPDRDPRSHNVSRAFKGKIIGWTLQAADDAKAIIKVDPKDLGTINFAFPDHKEMILEALRK